MENKDKFYLVYKTTNLKNNKFYIGVHETFNLDDGYLGSGKKLKNSVFYHGKENFKREILEFCTDKQTMYQKEKELVTEDLINNPKCMNLVLGGVGFIDDEKHKLVAKAGGKATSNRLKTDKKLLELFRIQGSKNFKKAHKEGKINYNTFEGKKHSEDTKKKIGKINSLKQKGEGNSQFGSMWVTNGKQNKKINKNEQLPLGYKKGRVFNTGH